MFTTLTSNDEVLEQGSLFTTDEVQYNLVHRISETENLIPMLYADLKNPSSNKIYRNIGFVKSGRIADIRFS
jgi:predicted GNAT family acetyltransferase